MAPRWLFGFSTRSRMREYPVFCFRCGDTGSPSMAAVSRNRFFRHLHDRQHGRLRRTHRYRATGVHRVFPRRSCVVRQNDCETAPDLPDPAREAPRGPNPSASFCRIYETSIRSETCRTIFSRSFFVARRFEQIFEFEADVEVVFDRRLAASGDHDDVSDSGANSLLQHHTG